MGTTASWTQENHLIAVDTALGKDKLLLESFSGVEEISTPFHFHLMMVSPEAELAPEKVLGKDAHITIQRPESERYIHGIISRFVQLGRDARTGLTTYEAELVPHLWTMSLGGFCQIFQDKNGLAIIESVLKDAGIEYQVRCNKAKSAPKREFCVQYRETWLNFVTRLMEEEGIFYYFEHTASKETLVLADQDTKVPSCPDAKTIHVSLYASRPGIEEVVTDLRSEFAVTTAMYEVVDYNYETSTVKIDGSAKAPSSRSWATDGIFDYPAKASDQNGATKEAARRLDRLLVPGAMVRGWSTCAGLTSGHQTTLADHYRSDVNTAYRLVRVEHFGSSSGFVAGDETASSYRNAFVGVKVDQTYLPPQVTPKPVIRGSQTALVVGKAGEEIWTDKQGRVKLHFYWNAMDSSPDETSSCWVRVSSLWAGKGFGWVHIPRIGEEVVVSFLDGDPDRPLITGRVYNDKHVPPWTLPGEQTKAGMRTRSSKGGGEKNYNELWLDDKKGSEMVFLHAEKDLTTEVENDETRTVGHNRTTTIEQDETKTVNKGNELRTVKQGNDTTEIQQGNQDIKVHGTQNTIVQTGHQNIRVMQGNQTIDVMQGDQTINVKQGNQTTVLDMGTMHRVIKMGNQTLQLDMGNQTVKANLGKIEQEAMMGIELTVGQSSIKIDQMGVTIKGMMIQIEGQIQTSVKGLMTQVKGDAMLQAGGGITMIGS